MRIPLWSLLALPLLAAAADPVPEVKRGVGKPQAVGVVHTLRGFPEACARLEGVFTGQAAQPYKLSAVRTSAKCQPRARLVSTTRVAPKAAEGWIFNDLVRVPNAGCPGQVAVLRVWRHPGSATPPERDAQGRVRLYLMDEKAAAEQAATQGKPSTLPTYAAELLVEGKACG